MGEKEGKRFSWDRLATVKRDGSDTDILHVLILVLTRISPTVWVESNWQRAAKDGKAKALACQPLSTLRAEAIAGKTSSGQTVPERQPTGPADSATDREGARALDYSEVPPSSTLPSRAPAIGKGEKLQLEQPKPWEKLWSPYNHCFYNLFLKALNKKHKSNIPKRGKTSIAF